MSVLPVVLCTLFCGIILAAPTPQYKKREVGGEITRTFPESQIFPRLTDPMKRNRNERELGGFLTRQGPLTVESSEEMWTVVQTDEENMTMDQYRGKIPLSMTEDFRGMIPVLPE